MESPVVFFTIFLLVLFANNVYARPSPKEYWQHVMKDQPMPEAIQGLVRDDSEFSDLSNNKKDCHQSMQSGNNDERKQFAKDFEPIPNVSVYNDDKKMKVEKHFTKDFEPLPNVSVYNDDQKLKWKKYFTEDFEPIPNVSVYNDDTKLKGEKFFTKDFEPIPNVSVYQG